MKKRKLLLHIFCFLTLLNIAILCNKSTVWATDTTAPTACSISINQDSSYTNNRYVTLDIYAEDDSDLQVWISNDGVTGTVTDFELGSTVTITDSDYVVGTALDSTNSTTASSSDNVFKIMNWPLTEVNETKKVRVVFNDAYGNTTSLDAYADATITITYDLNGVDGETLSSKETLPGFKVCLPEATATLGNEFLGWSTSSTATIANYTAGTIVPFDSDTTLYALFENKTIAEMVSDGNLAVGDYVAYNPDTATYSTNAANTGRDSVSLTTASTTWRILDIKEDTGEVILTTNGVVHADGVELSGEQGYINGPTELHNISAALYSNSELGITAESMTIEVLEEALEVTGSEVMTGGTYGTKYAYYPSGTSVSGTTDDGYTKTAHYSTLYGGWTEPRFYTWDSGGASKTDENGFEYRVPETDNPVKVTGTYYYYTPSSLTTDTSATVSEILGSSYGWLASPCVYTRSSDAYFCVRSAYSSYVSAYCLRNSYGYSNSPAYGLRPIVTLSSTLKVTGTDDSGAWTIEK